MAKQAFKSDLKLGRKKALKSTTPISEEKVEQIVTAIHEEPVVRPTIRFPKSLHRKIKRKVFELDMTMQDYLINLVKKDLGE